MNISYGLASFEQLRQRDCAFVLIDEYDNFTNALMSLGRNALYRTITHESGFLREFYKALKEGTSTGVVTRAFIIGVSPVTKRARAQAVEEQFAEGEAQRARYLSDPRIQALGGAKGWKSFTLVFEGLESLHFRAPGGMKRKLLAS